MVSHRTSEFHKFLCAVFVSIYAAASVAGTLGCRASPSVRLLCCILRVCILKSTFSNSKPNQALLLLLPALDYRQPCWGGEFHNVRSARRKGFSSRCTTCKRG
jgi:hypothetical protein